MSGVKIQKQPWIDYLIDTISKESDKNVSKYGPVVKVLVDIVKENPSEKEKSLFVLRSLKSHIIESARNKMRTENLMDGIIQFTEKIV